MLLSQFFFFLVSVGEGLRDALSVPFVGAFLSLLIHHQPHSPRILPPPLLQLLPLLTQPHLVNIPAMCTLNLRLFNFPLIQNCRLNLFSILPLRQSSFLLICTLRRQLWKLWRRRLINLQLHLLLLFPLIKHLKLILVELTELATLHHLRLVRLHLLLGFWGLLLLEAHSILEQLHLPCLLLLAPIILNRLLQFHQINTLLPLLRVLPFLILPVGHTRLQVNDGAPLILLSLPIKRQLSIPPRGLNCAWCVIHNVQIDYD